jgi:hypothetical protein
MVAQGWGSEFRGARLAFGVRALALHTANLNVIDQVRNTWQIYRDRRPDAYDQIFEKLGWSLPGGAEECSFSAVFPASRVVPLAIAAAWIDIYVGAILATAVIGLTGRPVCIAAGVSIFPEPHAFIVAVGKAEPDRISY